MSLATDLATYLGVDLAVYMAAGGSFIPSGAIAAEDGTFILSELGEFILFDE